MLVRVEIQQSVLTHWSIKVCNQSIWGDNRLKLDGMYSFVSIVQYTLIFTRSTEWSYGAIDEAQAIV